MYTIPFFVLEVYIILHDITAIALCIHTGPVITLNGDSPRLEGNRLHFNFVFAQPMKSVLCYFDSVSPVDCKF